MNLKKMFTGLLAATSALTIGLQTFASVTPVSAQETLTIAAGGHYDYVEANIAAFEEEFGVEVEVLDFDMFDALDGLALDGPSGQGADVYIAPYDRLSSLSLAGHIAEVELPEANNYDETDAAQVTVDDVIYGVPTVIESIVLYYNKDLIESAPQSFEDIEQLLQDEAYAFEGEEGKNVGFLTQWTDFYYAYGLIAGHGGYIFGDGNDVADIGLNNEGAVEGITYATKYFQEYWPQGMLDVQSAPDFLRESFINGETAAIIGGPWDAASFNDAGINYGVAKLPTLTNGEEYQAFAGGKAWAVSSYSENTDLANEFLRWVTSEEQQQIMYEQLGEIPANQLAREAVAAEDNELTQAVIETYANAQPMPNVPEMAEVWSGAETMMFDAGSGNLSPQESADQAVNLITEGIEQNY